MMTCGKLSRLAPRLAIPALLVTAAVALRPVDATAWGLTAHRWVALRAAEIAEPRCRMLVRRHGAELAARAVEPDTVLRVRLGREEEVRHFLDLDHYGAPPFRALPRVYAEAVRRFGREEVERQGTLPWHGASLVGRLERDIRGGDWHAARVTAGYLAHYAADATMPLHATENHDGQRTGQRGLHRRIEANLVGAHLGRYVERALRTPTRKPIPPVQSEKALFAALEDSYAAVAAVLAADRAARRGTHVGTALYYRRLDADLHAVLGDRLGAAAALTAALWEGACGGGQGPVSSAQPRQRRAERCERPGVEEHETRLGEGPGVTLEMVRGRRERDRGGLVERVAVDAGRYRREGDRPQAAGACEVEAVLVAGGQQTRHFGLAAVDRTDRVDDPARWQATAGGDHGVSRRQAVGPFLCTDLAACCEDLRPALAMDRAVHPAAAEQAPVGGVHDRIDLDLGEITLLENESATSDLLRRDARHAANDSRDPS